MSAIVRCSACHQRSRVGTEAIGLVVACPRCGEHFVAASDEELIIVPDRPIPTVQPRRLATTPRVARELPADEHPHHTGPNGLLISVALLPHGIPLLWLLARAITGRETVLSFAAPVAIGVGICGLCAGIALTHWTTAARIRAMLALVTLAYFIAGGLFFLQPGWLIEVRKNFAWGGQARKEFSPPDKAYTVKFPGNPMKQDASPVEGWPLEAFRFADAKQSDWSVYVAAHGEEPKEFPKGATDDIWFEKAKAALRTTGAEVVKDEPVRGLGYQAHEYELQFPEGHIRRVVRIVRNKNRVFYLSVEGPFLTGETPDVKDFMKSFTPAKPKP